MLLLLSLGTVRQVQVDEEQDWVQVAEAQARLEHNRRYVAFLQHQIDIKEARVAREQAQEDEVIFVKEQLGTISMKRNGITSTKPCCTLSLRCAMQA